MATGLEKANMAADLNQNGEVDPGDATLILRKAVGLD
jgi:hypothetical protein